MRIACSVFAAATFCLATIPALAKSPVFEIKGIEGKVLVATKAGLTPAKIGQVVPNGTRVFVGKGAFAEVASTDGSCNVTLPDEKVTVVNKANICDVQITPTAGDGGDMSTSVAAGLGFFGAASGVVIINSLDNDKPASGP